MKFLCKGAISDHWESLVDAQWKDHQIFTVDARLDWLYKQIYIQSNWDSVGFKKILSHLD